MNPAHTEEQRERGFMQARSRVSFLTWALESLRSPEKPRGEFWQQRHDDYVRRLRQAERDLAKWQHGIPS